jgi:hypothetical protein
MRMRKVKLRGSFLCVFGVIERRGAKKDRSELQVMLPLS